MRWRRAEAVFGRLVLLTVWLWLAACSHPPLYQQEAFVFGTRVEVQVFGAPEPTARAAVAAVLREFDRLHGAFHAWQPSELTRLNAAIARGDTEIEVSDELAAMLLHARQIALDSDGLFNPAIGELVGLWGFHADTFAPTLPAAAELEAWRAAGVSMADVDIEGRRVRVKNRAVQFDLGGYAKGYALDRAAAILRAQGIDNALINIGGNVIALGRKGTQDWRVGIANPRGTGAIASLALKDGEAIGTSGDYQRYFEIDGKRYCHLLDPRTGAPSAAAQGVTVLIPAGPGAGALSDALSKPLFIAGEAQWRNLAKRLKVTQALRVDAAGRVSITRAMAARLTAVPGQHFEEVD